MAMGTIPPTTTPDWPAVDEELLRGLPPITRGVVKALGIAGAGKFLVAHGGKGTYIPKHKSASLGLTDDELVRLRITLVNHIDADNKVELPKVDRLFRQARNLQIRRDRENASLPEMASCYSLTRRQITNIVREGDQLDLF